MNPLQNKWESRRTEHHFYAQIVADIATRNIWEQYFINIKLLRLRKCEDTKGAGASWPWSYGSWIYNYLCNQYISPLTLWVRIQLRRYMIKFVRDLRQVGDFSGYSRFPHQKNWPPRYKWNIVESGVKNHTIYS